MYYLPFSNYIEAERHTNMGGIRKVKQTNDQAKMMPQDV